MIIFVSKTSDKLNGKILDTEKFSDNICINPLYNNITIKSKCNLFCDSAAFQERNNINRISFEDSFNRQKIFENKLNQTFNYYVAYDKIDDVNITLKANKYLLTLPIKNKVLLIQGLSFFDYNFCLSEVLKLYEDNFILGFGGISKIGSTDYYYHKLFNAIENNLKELQNINHIHLFGVLTYPVILKFRSYLPNVKLSIDTSGIELKSVMGKTFKNGFWLNTYSKTDKLINYHPADLFKENLVNVLDFYKDL